MYVKHFVRKKINDERKLPLKKDNRMIKLLKISIIS